MKSYSEMQVCVYAKNPNAKPDEYQWVFFNKNGEQAPQSDEPPFMDLADGQKAVEALAGKGVKAQYGYEIP
jgi:hypothetical protein